MTRRRNPNTRGAAMLELALLSPWIIFLFIGTLDWGFYAYSMITLETATRSAAVYTSSSTSNVTDDVTACKIVRREMQTLINMTGVTACGTGTPIAVTATSVTGPDNATAAQVSVTYTTPQMIPIPGLLAKQFTITRVVKMKV